MFDSKAFKQQFPIFSHAENCNLVYLDNAATTQRPQAVVDAVLDFYTRYNANTHRSSHRLARSATAMVESVRQKTRDFLAAERSESIVFTRGATEALNILASCIGETLQAGDEVILSAAEHHANIVPWQMLAEKKQIVLRYLPQSQGQPQLQQLPSLLSEKTRVVSLTAASNALGFKLPIETIKPLLPKNCVFVVDASQLLAHEPVDVQQLGCDFLVASAHKFYGPTGVGVLYGRYELLAELPPWQGGGEMITRVTLQGSEFAAPPHRFEPGTSSLAAIAGLGAALDFLQQLDRDSVATYENFLNRYLHTELIKISQHLPLEVLTDFKDNVGIAALTVKSDAPFSVADLAAWFDEQDIAVRVGHHCAQPLMQALQVEGSLRISLAAYNNREDIDRVIEALQSVPDDWLRPATEVLNDHNLWVRDQLSSLSLDDLQSQNSWQKRYRQLSRWAECLSPKPEIHKDDARVHGCESDAWMVHRSVDGKQQFLIDTDSRVIKGLSVLLLLLINDRTAEEIHSLDFDEIFERLGLEKYLSPSRSNGFRALVNAALEHAKRG